MTASSLARFAPARLWARLDPLSRAVAGLGLLALIGPFGEVMDVAVFAEIEADFIAFDFGLEAIVTLLLPIYYLAMLLLLIAAAARGVAELSCGSPLPYLHIPSRHPAPPQHVPIL